MVEKSNLQLDEDNIRCLELVNETSKGEFFKRREELTEVDKKISQIIVFCFALVALIIQFIPFPKESLYGIAMYLFLLFFLISAITLLFFAYFPKNFLVPWLKLTGNLYVNNLRVIIQQYDDSWKSIDALIKRKNNFLKYSIICLSISLFLSLLIKLIQSIR